MNAVTIVTQQRQKESKALKIFVSSSLVGSLVLHGIALSIPVNGLWDTSLNRNAHDQDPEEMEILITDIPEEEEEAIVPEITPEAPVPEVPEEAPEQMVAFVPDPPPLGSSMPQTLGEDAPSPESPDRTTHNDDGGDLAVASPETGSITRPDGEETGFGQADERMGIPVGRPEGRPEGTLNRSSATPGTTAVRMAPPTPPVAPKPPPEPRCVSCPLPEYGDREASAKVDLRIRADGSVEVRLRESSGDPELDRRTLETMSQWRFEPQTVPNDGVQRRVRVTYEEEGSAFQRENERRRQEEVARQQREQEEEAERQQTLQQQTLQQQTLQQGQAAQQQQPIENSQPESGDRADFLEPQISDPEPEQFTDNYEGSPVDASIDSSPEPVPELADEPPVSTEPVPIDPEPVEIEPPPPEPIQEPVFGEPEPVAEPTEGE